MAACPRAGVRASETGQASGWSRAGSFAVLVAVASWTATGCVHAPASGASDEEGEASYYASALQGRRTASGARFDNSAMTCAHRTLPFGTRLRVTHLRTGRSVVVRVNDRGPFVRGRVVDLSRAAARELGMLREGHAPVRLEILR